MKIIDKYIAKTVLSSIGLVSLMLVGLQVFILFVNELDSLGRADFGIIEGPFQITSVEYAGSHDGEASYELSLASAGALSFKAI